MCTKKNRSGDISFVRFISKGEVLCIKASFGVGKMSFSLFGIKEVFVLFVRDLLYNDFNDKEEEL